jgi:ADP-heptose:LPS heptosyltransferase
MNWTRCKRILCIRPDNMGDLLMSGPAIRALKESFRCHITVLTSSMGAQIAGSMQEIDDTIIFDAPWVQSHMPVSEFSQTVKQLKEAAFDAAVIFTVYSQNPLPTVMLAYLAGIPLRLAYCRENPYQLLTDWVPDKEPYEFIRHQVRRDLDLVATVGATVQDEHLHIQVKEKLWPLVRQKLKQAGADLSKPLVLLHPEVSEIKRQYPLEDWNAAAQKLTDSQLLITGKEKTHIEGAVSLAGQLDLEELIVLIKHAALLISVNTGMVHIAAATQTPVCVLYALTNPQHTPWRVACKVLYFDVREDLCSKNEVVRHVRKSFSTRLLPAANTENILKAYSSLCGFQQPHSLP